MPGWLVTGGSGFLGHHILRAVADPAREVIALGRTCPPGWSAENFVRADLEDWSALSEAVSSIAPEVVIHAAGRTPPAEAGALHRANTLATLNLLEALNQQRVRTQVVLVGSAAELGPVAGEDLPVGEDYACRPVDAYARSKWMATTAGLAAWPALRVIVARVFNPIGPGLPISQAFGRFAEALAGAGRGPVRIVAGNLEARRDFIDARDAADALVALALRGRGGEIYHVGTGCSRPVGDGLDLLIRLSGRVVEVEEVARPGACPSDSRADIRKIREGTGWSPRIGWEQSLADLWEAAIARAD